MHAIINKLKILKTKLPVLPFLKGNTVSVNLLLFLGLTAFILIGVDLGSELSVQNNEIDFVIANLENLTLNLNFEYTNGLVIDLPFIGIVPHYSFSNGKQELFFVAEGRAPPLLSD